jgi:cytochrome P450
VKVYDPRRPTGLAMVLGNGLVTSSGEVWKRHRRIIQPIFHRSRMATMADRMAQVGEQRISGWTDHQGGQIDIAAEMMQLALEVISQTMLTTSMTQYIDRISHALHVSIKYAFDSLHNPLQLPSWVPTARKREFRAVIQFLDGLMYGLIAERRRTGATQGDLLDLLLQARDEETGAGLSDQELRDEALTIFAAGHETTANALAWTCYLLATHPDAKARFYEEVDRVLQGRTPTADDLAHLPYTRTVFDESLRLYLPAPAVLRKTAMDNTVGRLPLLAVRCAYMPFGAEPRACVGIHFAAVEGPLLLALIARRYDLQLAQEMVEPELMVTLRPKGGIRMTLQSRQVPVVT